MVRNMKCGEWYCRAPHLNIVRMKGHAMELKISLPICATLIFSGLAATLAAQDTASIPAARGVYYRDGSGWLGLTGTILMPMIAGTTADFFSVGSKQAIAEIPGLHAALQTTNARPTLYVRGFPLNSGIYLVHQTQKEETREIRMPMSHGFPSFAHLRSQDLREIEMRSVGNNVIAVTPIRDLAPGEYAIVSLVDGNDRNIKIGYDFGVAGGARK
jgi:hypothetical protein